MSQKLRGAPRLLFGNGCFYLDDIAEVKKKKFSLADAKLNFLQIVVYFTTRCIYIVFFGPKSKNSDF